MRVLTTQSSMSPNCAKCVLNSSSSRSPCRAQRSALVRKPTLRAARLACLDSEHATTVGAVVVQLMHGRCQRMALAGQAGGAHAQEAHRAANKHLAGEAAGATAAFGHRSLGLHPLAVNVMLSLLRCAAPTEPCFLTHFLKQRSSDWAHWNT